jgi:hypothetical protein
LTSGYGDRSIPLSSYTGLVALFTLWTGSLLAAESRRATRLSASGAGDLLLLGVATHKLSGLIAKDRVTSPFRAPFTRYEKSAGAGEVEEEARGEGLQKAIGQMVSCPFCVSPWVATALMTGRALAPRATRLFCGMLAAVGISHFLHHAWVSLEESHS